jgi:hypothetical protein
MNDSFISVFPGLVFTQALAVGRGTLTCPAVH